MKNVNGAEIFSTPAEVLDPAHTALIVVDVQNDCVSPEGWFAQNGKDVSAITPAVARIVDLVNAARAAGVFVVFIQQTTLPDNKSDGAGWLYFKTRDGRTRTDYCLPNTWGHAIVDELEPADDEPRVIKYRPSSFHGTSLDAILHANGIQSVVTCGVVSQGCVQATTMDASFHDYYTNIAYDCIAGYSAELHENAMTFMKSRYDYYTGAELAAIWSGSEAVTHA